MPKPKIAKYDVAELPDNVFIDGEVCDLVHYLRECAQHEWMMLTQGEDKNVQTSLFVHLLRELDFVTVMIARQGQGRLGLTLTAKGRQVLQLCEDIGKFKCATKSP